MTKPSANRRTAAAFRCEECGATSLRWLGRCAECQAWGSVLEVGGSARAAATKPGAVHAPARPISDHDASTAAACPTGISELDRVLGGGLVPGGVALLAGEPGVGKSTLLLEVAFRYAGFGGRPALIVTGEESPAQVRIRAERTGSVHPNLYLAAENDLGAVISHIDAVQPGLVVLDSVQTISTDTIDGVVGGVPQIRAVSAALISIVKQRDISLVIVGHVTKDGSIAGPRVLEHLVDVVLHFEGDRHSSLRLIRATKNRFGAADEVGCFEMREDGIIGLPDPSGLFLGDRALPVAGTCVTVTIEGRRPMATEIQALTVSNYNGGSPRRAFSDLDSSRAAMLLAVLDRHTNIHLSNHEVYASTVGGMTATEPAADLAIALAISSAMQLHPLPATLCAIGEVSLSGDIRRIGALERRLAEAARLGFTDALVPAGHFGDVITPAAVHGLTPRPVATLSDAITTVTALKASSKAVNRRRQPNLRVIPGEGPPEQPVFRL